MSIDEISKPTLSPGFEKKTPNSDANSEQSEALQDSQLASMARSSSTLEQPKAEQPKELGGRIGADPTRYGDWEKNGRCIDF